MNEQNRIWWIGVGGLLLLAVIATLLIKGPPPPENREKPASARNFAVGRHNAEDEQTDDHRFADLGSPPHPGSKRPVDLFTDHPDPTTEECLEALASNPREADRVWAARLLGRRANEEGLAERAVPALITAMENDKKPQMWYVSAQTLGKFGANAAEAVPSLMQWFDHTTMRDVAIEALGGIGPDAESAIESITLVAADDQERFISRSKAINALLRISGPDHPFVAAALQMGNADPDKRVGLAIRQALKSRQVAQSQADSAEAAVVGSAR